MESELPYSGTGVQMLLVTQKIKPIRGVSCTIWILTLFSTQLHIARYSGITEVQVFAMGAYRLLFCEHRDGMVTRSSYPISGSQRIWRKGSEKHIRPLVMGWRTVVPIRSTILERCVLNLVERVPSDTVEPRP